mmetsp:Transcript_1461/g.5183  ORF Transcript_1461/g.5183 Transcript_1461/m.5183 type:complete len:407 (-) Transcript_1461:850-2070(-)
MGSVLGTSGSGSGSGSGLGLDLRSLAGDSASSSLLSFITEERLRVAKPAEMAPFFLRSEPLPFSFFAFFPPEAVRSFALSPFSPACPCWLAIAWSLATMSIFSAATILFCTSLFCLGTSCEPLPQSDAALSLLRGASEAAGGVGRFTVPTGAGGETDAAGVGPLPILGGGDTDLVSRGGFRSGASSPVDARSAAVGALGEGALLPIDAESEGPGGVGSARPEPLPPPRAAPLPRWAPPLPLPRPPPMVALRLFRVSRLPERGADSWRTASSTAFESVALRRCGTRGGAAGSDGMRLGGGLGAVGSAAEEATLFGGTCGAGLPACSVSWTGASAAGGGSSFAISAAGEAVSSVLPGNSSSRRLHCSTIARPLGSAAIAEASVWRRASNVRTLCVTSFVTPSLPPVDR